MSSFIISLSALERNAALLREVAEVAGCHVVVALKGFSTWSCFDTLRPYLDGCCASGLWESLLANKHFGKHILTYSPAYTEDDIRQLCEISHHLDFNSVSQWNRYRDYVSLHPRYLSGEMQCGLRINPQCSTGHTPLYDPSAPGSRLGMIADNLKDVDLCGISGLHVHTLCEQGSEDLRITLEAVEAKFGDILARPEIKYLNLGGGHWITKPDYNRALLIKLIREIKERYQVDIWLEPGEAVVIHTGVLRCRVLDIFSSEGIEHAILDISASAHMPDTLEMPYRPDVFQIVRQGEHATDQLPAVQLNNEQYSRAGEWGEQCFNYRLGAPTCLAGDRLGDFSFPEPLQIGDELIFDDMSHYTMVKTTYFNGVQHPDIAIQDKDGNVRTLRQFSYQDFESRLG